MSRDQEKEIIQAILRQSAQEDAYVQRCHSDPALRVASQEQPFPVEPRGAFYFCRLLLDDLGMNSWDRRYESTLDLQSSDHYFNVIVLSVWGSREWKWRFFSVSAFIAYFLLLK